ncbi:MAG: sphingomyelin phosphodiesterase [Candidatus Sericytochromatia bacterium]|nr:sphingomyelin phosphodiesterase [Candidatus Tanganyikabacteria bacterium]
MMRRFGLVLALVTLVGCGAVGPGLQGPLGSRLSARAEEGVTLRLLSYNVFGLPAPLGKELKKRFAAIPQAIAGHDVVGLQETFTGESERILESGVYPHAYRQDKGTLFHPQSSGLTILSKYPLGDIRFRPFRKCATTDCLAQKGVLFARLDVPKVGPVDIYDTHFQAHAPYEQVRVEDVKDLVTFFKENDQGHPAFFLGDFNMLEDEDAYGHFKEMLGPIDAFRKANPTDPGYTADPGNPWRDRARAPEGERIDYVFYLPGRDVDVEVLDSRVTLKDQPLSDHYGVAATIRLAPRRRI